MAVLIGTSGWSYPHWQGNFYPDNLPSKSWLSYYSQNFQTVEVNSSFYHLPNTTVFKNWKNTTPENFLFALKASRFITHLKRLNNSQDSTQLFLDKAALLENKLGPILFQLPPRFTYKKETLENFLLQLPRSLNFSFEFRDSSWLNKECFKILSNFNVSLCFQDSPYWKSEEIITANFIYIRFHGGKKLYTASYSALELKKWATKIKKWAKEVKNVYVYFNNDAQGFAVQNAKTLINILKGKT